MASPLIETNVVFDEKILGVEFLPLPAQFPDYLVNLNSEIPNYRLKMIMDKILGPARVEGFGVTVDGPEVKVAPGLLMFSSYFVRLTQEVASNGTRWSSTSCSCAPPHAARNDFFAPVGLRAKPQELMSQNPFSSGPVQRLRTGN